MSLTRLSPTRRTPTYNSWRGMIERCTYPRHPYFVLYGGRGVTVCSRWRGPGGFQRFLEDLGARPAGKTLDRIDPDGHYEPANCRWADLKVQRWNRRDMAAGVVELEPVISSSPAASGGESSEVGSATPPWMTAPAAGEKEAIPF